MRGLFPSVLLLLSCATPGSPDGSSTPHEPMTVSVGGWSVVPGLTPARCVVVRLPNDVPAFVTSVRARLGPAGHHVTLLRTDETEERPEPFDCTAFGDVLGGATQPLVISQVPDDTLTLPPGVGFRLGVHQMVKIEAHFLDTGTAPVVADASVTLTWTDPPVDGVSASMGFYGFTDLAIPSGGEWSTPWSFVPVPTATRVFGVSAHTHAMGTNVEVERAQSAAVAGERLYPGVVPFDYRAPPVAHLAPAAVFASGDGLRYRCTWTNTSGKTAVFGDEMCLFWAYEYPSDAYHVCMNDAAGSVQCCPGAGCTSLAPILMAGAKRDPD